MGSIEKYWSEQIRMFKTNETNRQTDKNAFIEKYRKYEQKRMFKNNETNRQTDIKRFY